MGSSRFETQVERKIGRKKAAKSRHFFIFGQKLIIDENFSIKGSAKVKCKEI